MEGKTQGKSASVSRLPKFGGGTTKLSETLPQVVSNGACVRSVSASSSSKAGGKQNGTGCAGAFSFNWKKPVKTKPGGQGAKDPANSFPFTNEGLVKIDKTSYSKVPLVKDQTDLGFKSKSTAASRYQKQPQIVPYDEGSKIFVAGLNYSTKGNRGKMLGKPLTSSQIARSQSIGHFHKTSVVKMSEQDGTFSGSSSSKDSLSQSTESLKNSTDDNIVRSQSFSYSIQSNSYGTDVIPRSLSFSKAADRSCPRQQMKTGLPLKSNVVCYGNTKDTSSTSELLCKRTSSRPCLKAPSAFKKSLLPPSCPTAPFFAASSASKMALSSSMKCGRLASSGTASNVNSMSGTMKQNPGTSTIGENGLNNENVNIEHTAESALNVSTVDENTIPGINEKLDSTSENNIDNPEVLTISIDSNCDINDKSEHLTHSGTESIEIVDSDNSISAEILDDLYNPNEAMSSAGIEEPLIAEYPGTDWIETGLSDANYAMGSSFELSPSSSSAGTYMWDEEGMEALGTVQQCGSLESSEMNSLDILNNLESGDLDEDDLMLDVDLPEDTPCKLEACESMAHLERSERGMRNQGFWRKRYPRWSGQEQYHHGNSETQRSPVSQEPPVSHCDWHAAPSYCWPPSGHMRSSRPITENTVMLDVLTLRHMVHDCTSVKTQILKLKRLLQQNDDGSPVISPTQEQAQAVNSTDKTDELLEEIQGLQEEIKRKDQMIEELQQQLSTRCNCQKGNSDAKGPAFSNADKTTQTVNKAISPPVLQPSSPTCSSNQRDMGKIAKPVFIEDHSRCLENASCGSYCQTNQNVNAAVSSETDSDKVSSLQPTPQKIGDSNGRPVQEHPVFKKTGQSVNVPPKEHGHSQVSVQQASLASSSVFTEQSTNKDYRPRFAFRQCLYSKDTAIKSKVQSSAVKSPPFSKPGKIAAPSHPEYFPGQSSVHNSIGGQKESDYQLRLPLPPNPSTQRDEQQKRKSRLPPSLSSPLLNIKTTAFSLNPGSLAKGTQHVEPSNHRDESQFAILPSNKLQKKQSLREDGLRKVQVCDSQPEKSAASARHSRLPQPKMHVSSPSNCNLQG
ncbi:serine-rich coiled-coil domain-containing protein 2 isoform X2 [Scyliorhinus torazame]|uniref:serine-rich coiled-coil domain-containing protein 2 isoform X2 n=1 Tax=Scyliorhinus torazame TaxID=75743 RepID=UPI003B5BFD60